MHEEDEWEQIFPFSDIYIYLIIPHVLYTYRIYKHVYIYIYCIYVLYIQYIYTYVHKYTEKIKRKTEAQAIVLNPFVRLQTD